eukprot:TRINITY_DN986_c0_g1_i1.p1 TRINITY_DN986_c0_g1~~TRINITY_DN986_c0_g1_i1.p1  ORF type:complete len:370 (-),score=38.25 TRINITY_DN986_c0_g1_i1:752-1765(-)
MSSNGEDDNSTQNNRLMRRTSRHDNHDSDEMMNSNDGQFVILDSDSAYGVEGASPGSTQPLQIPYSAESAFNIIHRDSAQGQNSENGRSQNPQARQLSPDDVNPLDCDGRQDSVSEVERTRQSPLAIQFQSQQQQQLLYYQQTQLRASMPSGRSNSGNVDLYRFSSAPVENSSMDIRGKTVVRRDSASDLNTLLDDARSISLQNDMLLAARQLLSVSEGAGGSSSNNRFIQGEQGAELGVATEPELVAEAAALGLTQLDQISESGRIILDTMDSPRTGVVSSPTNQLHVEQELGESSRGFLNALDSPRDCLPAMASSSNTPQFRTMRSYDSDEQYEA